MLSNILKTLFVFCILLSAVTLIFSQNKLEVNVLNSTIITNNENIPLWFYANQYGKIDLYSQYLNVTDLSIDQTIVPDENKKISWLWGGNFIVAFGKNNYTQLNKAYGGISYKGWELKGGLFGEEIQYAGLSSTNGNYIHSTNYRPYPKIRISNPLYKPIGKKNWLKFKLEFEEGILNDKRYVSNTHIHHKSLYFKIQPHEIWDLEIGLEHFVMYGGTSLDPEVGRLPVSITDYFRYIFALEGGKDLPEHDQLNAAGNHIGSYQIRFSKYNPNYNFSIYICHPFENHPGMKLRNWRDNLIGLYIGKKNSKAFISDIVYEYINSKNQNIKDSLYFFHEPSQNWSQRLYENYFRHEIYVSGYIYNKNVLGSPLFFPVIKGDDSVHDWYVIRSNRLDAHHLGVQGFILKQLRWKSYLTYIRHFGTYKEPYESVQKQVSGLLEFQYVNPQFPVEIGISGAMDRNNFTTNSWGFKVFLEKNW